ncbi:LysR family transcriptional regulator [Rhizobiales bacterium L72]|uniref:LysR family transcriptional regulator n=2 Tax=Propylenella binzhouense TaxID=2555902 RepID=A0A964T4C3_9HYPH|nr:LysR family transcriptional regulator [Propylenella binzhouense]
MNKFQAISAFVQVVKQGGFSAAGKKLGMSASAVTKSIARLEDQLGTQLLNRTTRRIALTEYGQEFFERCDRILSDLDDAESAMRDSSAKPQGLVRAVMPFSFGRVTVIPALPKFFERNPEISLEIKFSDLPVDLIQEGYDLAVRTGDLVDSRLMRRVLTRGPMTVAASPDYLARHGTPQVPEDLARHCCVIGKAGSEWTFTRDQKPFKVRVEGNLRLLSGDAYREAAVHGLGIGYSTRWLFRKDIENGRLVSLLDDYMPDGVPISVVYNDKRHIPRKMHAFINFLLEITRSEELEERPRPAAVAPAHRRSETLIPGE